MASVSADAVAPADALLPALGRLDALLRAVAGGEPGAASIASPMADDEPPSRLTQLGDTLGLAAFDLDVLLLAMAPELDRGYAPLFAALQQDPFAWRPSIEVASRCCAQPTASASAAARGSARAARCSRSS